MTTKLAILDDYQRVALEMADWSGLPGEVDITVFADNEADLDKVAARLAPFEVLAAMRERTPFPRALFEKLPNLKLLVTTGMRNGAIDMAAAADHNVTVCGTAGSTEATVEMIWALIQAVVRQIPQEDKATRMGKWQTSVGWNLAGRTIGLVGLGRLGARTAAIANFFNMRVIAWSENLTAERARECGAERVSKAELFSQADVVSIHLILSKRSRGLIGADDLALMKPDAYLVNTSRGPIVDENAMLEVLEAGRIGGAALDVYDLEPLPTDHPLLRLENVIISPHMAYVTAENMTQFHVETVEDIAAWLKGEPIRVLTS
ncbi:MAG: D-2-hydroxyacid dehydrogenase family protein [Rhodospirillaceae bacterium]|jgi:phosphoglycerate dehydrogenase-like enzyme|nr:D-2-hydroxyacid dehydrogenase family protein [Rhodospirillaceae bacterium]MBT4688146.1 D-2-hydroxyacid dehydrogenase family protein [Rhodospirillaceae bacterium]MBT5082782.1 D-2-hydroxyacid dehydrogenase family protein [Rhodospirillaceae bacterium]MBT5524988.1 D-2-hydroxyacid dehydrogenase family protein [Rhodospirillaceae bacterium]MBT5881011.1 D-2-hydroxyacid dehydrogenase family protein [Rhodospirillaceae bacterium]